jgi:hypothetical protein
VRTLHSSCSQALSSDEERKALRRPLNLSAELMAVHLDATPVQVADVSRFGCRVCVSQKISIGSFVTVHVPEFTSFNGWVAWSRPGGMGLDWAHPLPQQVVDQLVERSSIPATP